MGKKLLNILLLVAFIITIMAPVTGIIVHKMASLLFLLLCLIHTVVYRDKMNGKRYAVIGMILLSFVSGIMGMILDHIPMVLAFHKAISILIVFFVAIHVFVFHKRMGKDTEMKGSMLARLRGVE